MMYINESFEKGFCDYLKYKNNSESVEFNSFYVVVIRALLSIYSEELIDAYESQDEKQFDSILEKYGYPEDSVFDFKRKFDGYYVTEERNKKDSYQEENIYFIETQKCLVDMFAMKRKNYGITASENREFYDLLYTTKCSNPYRISWNYYQTNNLTLIEEYFKKVLEVQIEVKDNFNPLEVFNVFNNSLTSNVEFDNNGIIAENNILDKKEKTKVKGALTSGNGYVDILIILGVVSTAILTIGVAIMML